MSEAISVIGAGYVGLTTAVIFANAGFRVYLLENDPKRLATLQSGVSFFFEKGINPLLKNGLAKKTLTITNNYAVAIPNSSVVFSCVGTPDNKDGSTNMTYLFGAAKSSYQHLKPGTIYVQKSTVPVGTGSTLAKDLPKGVTYVSNPEFLREGSAIIDTLFADRVVVGSDHRTSAQRIAQLYAAVTSHRSAICRLAGIESTVNSTSQQFVTGLNSAELIKVTSNAFLALKISFANSIATLADAVEADTTEIMNAVGADTRIGHAFLQAGRGYGGGCFPKDVSGLISAAKSHDVDLPIMRAARDVNESMPRFIVHKLETELNHSLKGEHIALLGLSFKANTSDIRRSPGIAIASLLSAKKATITAYDPEAETAPEHATFFRRTDSLQAALQDATIIMVTTNWAEFTKAPLSLYAQAIGSGIFFDATNSFNKRAIANHGMHYVGVGRLAPIHLSHSALSHLSSQTSTSQLHSSWHFVLPAIISSALAKRPASIE